MDAQPELALLANVLERHKLEAVLIGNMAAALHGAPVTTADIDFLFRATPGNITKLKASDGMQIDFMGRIDGVRSWEGIRRRAIAVKVGGATVWAATLADVVKSKRAAGRPKDKAVLDILEKTLNEEKKLSAK